jgi:hypothetical protein
MSQRKKNLEARSNKHFEARLQEFIQFKKDSGRWPDEHSIDKEERSLGMWVRKAKNDYNNGTLNKTRETAFIKLAFTLNVFEEEWNRKFEALKIFIVINRRLPSKREELYNFSGYNHRKFHLFDKERKKLLKSIGFTKLWDKKDIDSLVTPTTTFYIMKCRNAIVGCPGKDTFPNPKFHPEFIK